MELPPRGPWDLGHPPSHGPIGVPHIRQTAYGIRSPVWKGVSAVLHSSPGKGEFLMGNPRQRRPEPSGAFEPSRRNRSRRRDLDRRLASIDTRIFGSADRSHGSGPEPRMSTPAGSGRTSRRPAYKLRLRKAFVAMAVLGALVLAAFAATGGGVASAAPLVVDF